LLLGTPTGIGAEPALVPTAALTAPQTLQARNVAATGMTRKPGMVMLMLFGSGAGSQGLFGRLGQ